MSPLDLPWLSDDSPFGRLYVLADGDMCLSYYYRRTTVVFNGFFSTVQPSYSNGPLNLGWSGGRWTELEFRYKSEEDPFRVPGQSLLLDHVTTSRYPPVSLRRSHSSGFSGRQGSRLESCLVGRGRHGWSRVSCDPTRVGRNPIPTPRLSKDLPTNLCVSGSLSHFWIPETSTFLHKQSGFRRKLSAFRRILCANEYCYL